MSRTVQNLEGHYIYNYIAPDKEGVQVYRMPPCAKGGDTYQVIADFEGTAEEAFDAITDFDLMQSTSSVINKIIVHEKTAEHAKIEMTLHPQIDSGTFYYRYSFDRPNTQMFFWMYDYKGPNRQWYAINVETRVYQFGKIARIILTETFVMVKDIPNADAIALFTGVAHDMINRTKKRRELKK